MEPKTSKSFIKYKSEWVPYKQVKIDEFTDTSKIPSFDHSIKWKCFEDKPPRRKLGEGSLTQANARQCQSVQTTENQDTASPVSRENLTRQHSTSSEK